MSRRRQQTVAKSQSGDWTSPGLGGGGTFGKKSAEQERPYPAAKSGKDRTHKAGRLKADGAGRESEGLIVPVKA
jgi:hypothetical protein